MSAATATEVLTVEHLSAWPGSFSRTDAKFFEELSRLRKPPVRVSPSTVAPTDEREYRTVFGMNSTSPIEFPNDIREELETLFNSARELEFEDGIENPFSREIVSVIRRYGETATAVLASLIVREKVSTEAAAETLRWLGRMSDPATYRSRLWLLERCLNSSSLTVRDGAALGLAAMDDPTAIRYLELAIRCEQSPELRKDMEQVLEQLEAVASAILTEEDTQGPLGQDSSNPLPRKERHTS